MLPTITFDDFAKIDMRMGLVVRAEVPEGSRSVIRLTVDFGEELGERTIFVGIKPWYEPKELEGKTLPFVVNLEPKTIGDLGESQGMMLAASPRDDDGNERAVLLLPDMKVDKGTKLR